MHGVAEKRCMGGFQIWNTKNGELTFLTCLKSPCAAARYPMGNSFDSKVFLRPSELLIASFDLAVNGLTLHFLSVPSAAPANS